MKFFQSMKSKAVVVAGLALALAQPSMAQVAETDMTAIKTSITGAVGDLTTIGVAVLTGMVGFWAVRVIGKKFGWWA